MKDGGVQYFLKANVKGSNPGISKYFLSILGTCIKDEDDRCFG
jgi:hypothetical protein